MMLPILADVPECNTSMFDYISLKNEIVVKPNTTEMLDYMVTFYPRNERIDSFNFVYGLFKCAPVSFAPNQSFVIHFATEMFSRSEPLGDFESAVLGLTFKRLAKVRPTLPGRK